MDSILVITAFLLGIWLVVLGFSLWITWPYLKHLVRQRQAFARLQREADKRRKEASNA